MAVARKKARKKAAKKTSKKGPTLRAVPYVEYEFVWDDNRDTCHFGHKSGCASDVGCGLSDTVLVYKDSKKRFYILSVNYAEGYAGVEILDEDPKDPVVGITFLDPKQTAALFGPDLTKVAPKTIASTLAAKCLA